MNRAVFLDRDGVLVANVYRDGKWRGARTLSECIFSSHKPAVKALKKEGFKLILVTNQPDIALRKVRLPDQEEINLRVQVMFDLDDVIMCPHSEEDRCECRKPRPGMLMDAAHRHHLDLSSSWIIGDRLTDIQAGRAAGCRGVLIGGSFRDSITLAQAVEYVLSHQSLKS